MVFDCLWVVDVFEVVVDRSYFSNYVLLLSFAPRLREIQWIEEVEFPVSESPTHNGSFRDKSKYKISCTKHHIDSGATQKPSNQAERSKTR